MHLFDILILPQKGPVSGFTHVSPAELSIVDLLHANPSAVSLTMMLQCPGTWNTILNFELRFFYIINAQQ